MQLGKKYLTSLESMYVRGTYVKYAVTNKQGPGFPKEISYAQ